MPRFNGLFNKAFPNYPKTTSDNIIPEGEFVDIGGNGDCGFLAMTGTIISNILKQPTKKKNLELSERFLDKYTEFFPEEKSLEPYLTPFKHFEQLTSTPSKLSNFIRKLAFIIRQLAVDEMCKHPDRYPGAFVENNEGTSPEEMRKATTWIDESALAAASTALKLSIEVNKTDEKSKITCCYGKEYLRPSKGLNTKTTSDDTVVIKLESGHYTPLITGKDQIKRFKAIKKQPRQPIRPSFIHQPVDPDLPEILERIKQAEKQAEQSFQKDIARLTQMVDEGLLDKNDLLTIYILGMGKDESNKDKSDYLQGHIKYATHIKYAIEHFGEDTPANKNVNDDQETISELIHALARAISIGQLDKQEIEAQCHSHRAMSNKM